MIGFTEAVAIHNDPNGEADFVPRGYTSNTNGAGQRYSWKNWLLTCHPCAAGNGRSTAAQLLIYGLSARCAPARSSSCRGALIPYSTCCWLCWVVLPSQGWGRSTSQTISRMLPVLTTVKIQSA
ncbi:MAG: hypothetical protein WD136_07670 [Cyanobium sp.]